MQQKGPEQERQRWETLISRRLAEGAEEQSVVQELVGKGADIHLARDFVRRVAERQPQTQTQARPQDRHQPAEAAPARSERRTLPMDMVVGMVLIAAGLIAAFLLYVMDMRSPAVYVAFVAMLIGLVLTGMRAYKLIS
jgi:hypothetical protein